MLVRAHSDKAWMTSKRGKNKEVRYEPQSSRVTDVLMTFYVRFNALRFQNTRTDKWSLCFIHFFTFFDLWRHSCGHTLIAQSKTRGFNRPLYKTLYMLGTIHSDQPFFSSPYNLGLSKRM